MAQVYICHPHKVTFVLVRTKALVKTIYQALGTPNDYHQTGSLEKEMIPNKLRQFI